MAREKTKEWAEADAIDKVVGQNIRRIRMDAGWGQQKLADALGITFQQVQKYEKGVNRISAGKLYQVVQLLNTTLDVMFAGADAIAISCTETADGVD